MTAASGSNRQSPSQSQSATPPPASKSAEESINQPQPQVAASNQLQQQQQSQIDMATNVKPQPPPTANVAPQQLPPSTSTYFLPASNVVSQAPGHFSFSPFMAPHLIHQQQQQKLSPAFPPANNYSNAGATYAPPVQQFNQKVESPKRANDSSILNSMCNRSQRCGVCKGCTNSACGQCNFCHDSPQFGGPGVKKQSCLERRCHRVLENKLQRDAPSFRARRGCGQCEDCRVPNCNACLVCFDRRYFDNRYIPGAMCARKRCNHAVLLDNSTRMRPPLKKRSNDDNYASSPKPPVKRPSPSETQQEFAPQRPQMPMPNGINGINGNSGLTQRLLQPMIGQPMVGQQPQQVGRPAFAGAIYNGVPGEFTNVGFQPPTLQMDPNANRLFQPTIQPPNPNGGMCLFQPNGTNGLFLPAANPQPNFYFIPQPLQPTAIHSSIGGGKEIKDDTSGSPTAASNEDPYQPPSYNQESNGSVVLQAL